MKRIAWFSAMGSSLTTRSAQYSRTVLPLLKDNWEIEIFVNDFGEYSGGAATEIPEGMYHFLRATERHRIKPFDACVYHIENSAECLFTLLAAPLLPSWLVLHDLHAVINELGLDKLQYAPLVTVFSGAGLELINNAFPQASILRSEFPVSLPADGCASSAREMTGEALLERSGLQNQPEVSVFRIAMAAWQLKSELGESILLALRQLYFHLQTDAQIWQLSIDVLAFSEAEKQEAEKVFHELTDECQEMQALLRVNVCLTPEDLHLVLSEASCLIYLTANLAQGVPPYVFQGLACGVPLIISRSGMSEDLPSGLALGIKLGVGEEGFLFHTLLELMTNSRLQQSLSLNARIYAGEILNPCSVCEDFEQAFFANQERLKKALKEQEQQMAIATQKLWNHAVFEPLAEVIY